MLIDWSLGKPAFGIQPVRPLRSVLIQVENSDAVLHQSFHEVCEGMNLTDEEIAVAGMNIIIHRESSEFGLQMVEKIAAPLCADHSPDIVVLDPLTQLYGGDMNSNQDAAKFLNAWSSGSRSASPMRRHHQPPHE